MSDAFNAALCRATQLSKPKEEEKTSIKIFGMAGGGGLSHIQNSMNIGGQPHRLAYLKPNKASLLKQLGGSGKSVNGVPAYYFDSDDFSFDWSDDSADTSDDAPAPGSSGDPSRDTIAEQQVENLAAIENAIQSYAIGSEALDLPTSLEQQAQIDRDAALAAAYANPDYTAPPSLEQIAERAAIERVAEEAVQSRVDMWASKPGTSKDFKEAFEKLGRPVGGKFANAKDVTNWTQAQIDAYLEENPGAVIANTMIDLEGTQAPTTYHDLSDRYGFKGDIQRSQGTGAVQSAAELEALSGAGLESGGVGRGHDFESYADAAQYSVDQIRKARQEEQDELDKENIYRQTAGLPPLSEPIQGWKSPELHESMVFDLANWAIQTGSGISGELLNFLQRQYGSGEFGGEVAGWKDIMDYYNNLGILTGYRGPQFMETYMGEKGSPGEYYNETDPNIQPQTPQEKKKEEEIKKLGLMAKFFEEEDEDEKKKIANDLTLLNLTEDEQALIQTAYGETGLPSLMDQIG
tara:strand:- start:78 stop:1637 length:1560 start_codon:yes stop_codon:yes gene_type:complete